MSVVIVDDSATNLIILKQLAKKETTEPVETFSRALKALDYLTSHRSELIIVDCEMPEMNGISFIAHVRRLEHHAMSPIVMVTNHTDKEVRQRALAAGATDFLSKPVNAHEFRVRMRTLMMVGAAQTG